MDDSDRLSALRTVLAQRLGSQRYELWLGTHTTFEFAEGQLTIGCPSKFECQWLRNRLQSTLSTSCQQVWEYEVAINFQVNAKSKSRKRKQEQSDTTQKLLIDVATESPSSAELPSKQPRVDKSIQQRRTGDGGRVSFSFGMVGLLFSIRCRSLICYEKI